MLTWSAHCEMRLIWLTELGKGPEAQTYQRAAHTLAEALNAHLWDEAAGTYRGGILGEQTHPPTVPAAFLTLYFDVVPPARRPRVQQWLQAHQPEQGGLPYAYQFLFEALYGIDTDEADRLVLALMREKWAAMAQSETGTVWEGFGPGENCHEAGSVPGYILSARVLGVSLEGPVWERRLRLEPRLGDLQWAEGVVVTELGLVPVRWRRGAAGATLDFEIEIPRETLATIALPCQGRSCAVLLDDRNLTEPELQLQGRYAVMKVGPGPHRGRLTMEPLPK